ncbi:hypothetical protein T484DRAFT_1778242 [Baffinella frigidus]|nr:hypothetical protein T484DRAFT_1778242 [Cryptophyta sp. CCMP2293]
MRSRLFLGAVAASGATAVAYREQIASAFRRKLVDEKPSFSFVGYIPHNDTAIVQWSNEREARVMPASDVITLGGHPQLLEARRISGKF